MAAKDQQKAQKQKANPTVQTKKVKRKKVNNKVRLFLILLIIMGAVFLPTAVLLTLGLLPSFVAYFTDRSEKKTRAVTVIMMNFAGCTPFLMELWTTDYSMEQALAMITNTIPLIVMYASAAVGYLIDWAMTYIVANLLYQRGKSRIRGIEKRQADLIERWGNDVSAAVKKPEEELLEDI